MARITAYTSTKMDQIADATIQDANIVVGGGDTRNLRLTQRDASIVDLGDVKGPEGDQGPVGGGLTSQQAQDQLSTALQPGPWQAIPYDAPNGWGPLSGYQTPRYRMRGTVVELDGMLQYTDVWGYGPIQLPVAITGVNAGGIMPVEMVPQGAQANPVVFFQANRDYGEPIQIYVIGYTPTSGIMSLIGGDNAARTWVTGTWLSLCGCSYDTQVDL